ncbi:hypothetical protein [uncultured Roseivirga sp.]|uniref:hypothetical protein n=1 Tax=uncultured Roseivirga sp. TaxID=543088 RepID=UPI0030DA4014|tara:strand:+ start:4159 stop:5250 length:1092 start_codon:yes stop_codon:yes gene_type:complete
MKKLILSLFALCLALSSTAQTWTTSVPNIYYTGGNVGIGTTSPSFSLEVRAADVLFGTSGTEENRFYFYSGSDNESSQFWMYNAMAENTIKLKSDGDSFFNGGNVGIGTTSPQAKLHVEGDVQIKSGEKLQWGGTQTAIEGSTVSNKIAFFTNSLERFRVDDGGNVGIGTTSPSEKLELIGNMRIKGVSGFSHGNLQFYRANGFLFMTIGQADLNVANSTFDFHHHNGNDIRFLINNSENLRIKLNGNIGIGTTSPTEKLEVNGTIRSKKVKVETTGWPDFVFASNFKLRTLNELEAYIKANQHLPEVPSAKDVEENGLDLGKMDATLLQKVEELTLYLIEMNKKVEKLEKENLKLKKSLENK